jgi:hypothetical protein
MNTSNQNTSELTDKLQEQGRKGTLPTESQKDERFMVRSWRSWSFSWIGMRSDALLDWQFEETGFMESALHRVPVEIWRYIFSLILDIVQISDADYDIQELVKIAEKNEKKRRNLRSVCKGWNDNIKKDPVFVDVTSMNQGRQAKVIPLADARRSKVINLEDSFKAAGFWGLHSNDLQYSLGRIIEAETELRVLNVLM